jgi:hypothetical protein
MLRKVLVALFVFGVTLGFALADEIKGKVKSVDADKNTITVTVDGTDKTFDVNKDATVKVGKATKLGEVKAGANVILTTKDNKVTDIKGGGKKTKDK